MDIMKPALVLVNGNWYRRLDIPAPKDTNSGELPRMTMAKLEANEVIVSKPREQKRAPKKSNPQALPPKDISAGPVPAAATRDDADATNNFVDQDIRPMKNETGFEVFIHVPRMLHGLILGSKAATKKRIESETGATIDVPRREQHDDTVIVSGPTKDGVREAKKAIVQIMQSRRRNNGFTHFVSIPCNVEEIQSKFEKFKREVLTHSETMSSRGMDEKIFQIANKLHLTVTMLAVLDEKEGKDAVEILKKCVDEEIRSNLVGKELKFILCGLDYMNDDPEEVAVLYANVVDGPGRSLLQQICDTINSRFAKTLFTGRSEQQNSSPVKLHVTLMNTKFMSSEEDERQNNSGRRRPPVTFDASRIMELFGDYMFGELTINKLHLSIRHTQDKSGYYKGLCNISLP